MIIPIKLPKEQKDQIIASLQNYFSEERSETIGDLGAEQIVDFMISEIGPYIYNKAIEDARQAIMQKISTFEDDLYALARPIKRNNR